MRKLISRVLVALMIPEAVALLLEFVDLVLGKMGKNASFPNPNPTLLRIRQAADALILAQTTKNTVKGTRAARDERKKVLRGLMKDLGMYVETTANADPENARAIIESSGFHVKKDHPAGKQEFEVKQGEVSGEVLLIVKSVAKYACYEFQYSTDQKSWTTLPKTVHTKSKASGFTPGTTYFFRFRTVTKAGESDWSHVLDFMPK